MSCYVDVLSADDSLTCEKSSVVTDPLSGSRIKSAEGKKERFAPLKSSVEANSLSGSRIKSAEEKNYHKETIAVSACGVSLRKSLEREMSACPAGSRTFRPPKKNLPQRNNRGPLAAEASEILSNVRIRLYVREPAGRRCFAAKKSFGGFRRRLYAPRLV